VKLFEFKPGKKKTIRLLPPPVRKVRFLQQHYPLDVLCTLLSDDLSTCAVCSRIAKPDRVAIDVAGRYKNLI